MDTARTIRLCAALLAPMALLWTACATTDSTTDSPASPSASEPTARASEPEQTSAPKPPACPDAGQKFFKPGCESESTKTSPFAEGCYAPCSDKTPCSAGFTCTLVWYDPCHGEMCDACGGEGRICLPGK